ncbi:MAG TPA: hypothetical protein PKC43_06370 [Phycisphaerales bacterium]|nr:hypothetical protein [Phycisphaerales bacterium]HMP37057.1 hypothetical protein [Phycisphaerales bacterium]
MLTHAEPGDVVQVVSPVDGRARLAMLVERHPRPHPEHGPGWIIRTAREPARGCVETWLECHLRWPQRAAEESTPC